ncbi:MAG: ABC transporter ATP-binding protein/permease [Saprospiraceae bacterium]|nr:ABC transporter ATP-binding protein/permease [Saprospiraceae bacterium]
MNGFWQMMARIRDYRRDFTLSILSNILLSIFTIISIPLLIPFFQILFDRVQESGLPPSTSDINAWIKYYMARMISDYGRDNALMIVCCLLILVFFLKNTFRYSALYFMVPIRNGIIYDLRQRLFKKYLELPLSFYSNERKGILLSSMTLDVQEVEWSILNVIESIFKSPIIMAGSIFFMLYISPELTLFVFFLVLFAGFIIGKVVTSLRDKSANVQDLIANLTAQVEETLGGLRIIKGFNAEEYQIKKFSDENHSFRKVLTRVVNRRDLAAPMSEFLGVTVVTILMWYGSQLVFDSQLAPETFFAFVFAFYQVIEPAKSFSAAYFSIQKGMAAVDRLDRILEAPTDIFDREDAVVKTDFTHSVDFENVTFVYKDNQLPALSDVSTSIKKGQIVALVGSSGAGKSTFVDLLPRFYDVSQGRILIDGTDIRYISLQSLRSLFGIVSQDPILFHDTIANNISFGDPNIDIEKIISAAKIANAHDFISALPDGYHTNVGDRGLKLSGGQRQRLTIARAVLRNPPILILDEATSALDAESERLVQDALQRVMASRTSIVVAHRLATIQEADLILVLENGKIVQSGTHSTLMNESGPYQKFASMQSFAESIIP